MNIARSALRWLLHPPSWCCKPRSRQPPTTTCPDDLGPNEWLVDEMYEQFRADPASVSESWQEFFADYRTNGEAPAAVAATAPAATPAPAEAPAAPAAPAAAPAETEAPVTAAADPDGVAI